jgi:hypothetical protein
MNTCRVSLPPEPNYCASRTETTMPPGRPMYKYQACCCPANDDIAKEIIAAGMDLLKHKVRLHGSSHLVHDLAMDMVKYSLC